MVDPLPPTRLSIMVVLLHGWNRSGRGSSWRQSTGSIQTLCDVGSRTTFIRQRNALQQSGYIEFENGNRSASANYSLGRRFRDCVQKLDTKRDVSVDVSADASVDVSVHTLKRREEERREGELSLSEKAGLVDDFDREVSIFGGPSLQAFVDFAARLKYSAAHATALWRAIEITNSGRVSGDSVWKDRRWTGRLSGPRWRQWAEEAAHEDAQAARASKPKKPALPSSSWWPIYCEVYSESTRQKFPEITEDSVFEHLPATIRKDIESELNK